MNKNIKSFLLKTFIWKILSNLLVFRVKLFSIIIKEAVKSDPSIINNFNKIQKQITSIQDKALIQNIKKFGKNSNFWGNHHLITCPQNLEIGENVHIGNNCFIRAEGGVSIGDNTHISRNFVLYSINHNFLGHNLPYDESTIEKPVKIGKNVWIGMNVCIVPGAVIGDGSIIGMGTIVSGHVPELSIIGSQKWRIIGKRDAGRYEYIDSLGRYGGVNGEIFVDFNKDLLQIGDKRVGRRNVLEVIDYEGHFACKKKFIDSNDALTAFESEKRAISILSKYSWFPKVYEIGKNYVIYEYFDSNSRLDRAINILDPKEKHRILIMIIGVLMDLHTHNVAHRDFHAGNIFYSNNYGLKLIDYETLTTLPDVTSDFFNSYDIVGKNLSSPFYTNHMCVFNSSSTSISTIFNIKDIKQFIQYSEEALHKKLYEESLSFYSQNKKDITRHFLKNPSIYNTFDLPYLKVKRNIGQRDIKRRINKFGITKGQILGKKVLDIGSNIGGILLEIYQFTPEKAIGIEYDQGKVDIANMIAKIHGFKNIEFLQMDVESESFLINYKENFEIIFCLALIEHLYNKEQFIRKLASLCSGILFLEGNSTTDIDSLKRILILAGFHDVHFIGKSDDEKNESNNNRPLLICKK